MKIDKSQIADVLASRGDHATAAQADKSLPDQLDTDHDGDLLHRFGVDVSDLSEKVARRGVQDA